MSINEKLKKEVAELEDIIKEKDKIIDELMAENKEYKKLYWDSRARQDEGE